MFPFQSLRCLHHQTGSSQRCLPGFQRSAKRRGRSSGGQWGRGACGHMRNRNSLRGICQRADVAKACEKKRWWQPDGCTQGAVQARCFGRGVVVPRNKQLHGASAAAHHIHGLWVHPRRSDCNAHRQHKPSQHEAGKSVGVAQGLQSHTSLGCVRLAYCLGLWAISPCWCPPMPAPPPGAV